jgi:hypothetical protein
MAIAQKQQPQQQQSKGSKAAKSRNKNDRAGGSESSDEEGSSSDETSVHESSSDDHKATEVKEVQKLSQWETFGIRFWRTIVLLLLIIAGCLVSAGTYLFLRGTEQANYINRVSSAVGYCAGTMSRLGMNCLSSVFSPSPW